MFVKFVPLHNGEVKHVKIQVEEDETFATLKEKLKTQFKLDHFKVLFHGRQIHDSLAGDSPSIVNFKMNPNSTIHVIESFSPQETPDDVKKPPPSDDELQQFMIAFGLAVRKDKGQPFMKIMQRLRKRENLENIAATCPELTRDPVARAFLSKPELIYSLLDPDTLKYVYEKHPSICEAASQLSAAVHEEKPSAKSNNDDSEGPMPPFAYNMDEMSDDDDDEEEMEVGEGNRFARGRRSIPSSNPITADQFASALAAAQSALGGVPGSSPGGMGGMTGFTSQRPPTSAAPSSSRGLLTMPSASGLLNTPQPSSSGSRGPGITQDQLGAALAFAFGGSLPATPTPGSGTAMPNFSMSPAPQSAQNFDTQLATMRELGITDTALARRALQIMGGDVQAAIDLIYSGWNGEGDSVN